MSDSDKWREFDLAESSLGLVISYYSKIIDEEESKSVPDMEKVAQWQNERHTLAVLKRGMRVDDQEAVANIKAKYEPIARELLQKSRAARKNT